MSPCPKGSKLYWSGEIRAVGEQYIGGSHLVLDFIPEQVLYVATGVEQTHDGPHIHQFANGMFRTLQHS